MQVALPRTQDAGNIQEQMSKQHQRFQESLAQTQLKEEIIKRKQVNKFEEIKDQNVTDKDKDKENQNESEQNLQQKKQTRKKAKSVDHPYLGSKIDFSG